MFESIGYLVFCFLAYRVINWGYNKIKSLIKRGDKNE